MPGQSVKPRTRALAGAGVLAAITATVVRFLITDPSRRPPGPLGRCRRSPRSWSVRYHLGDDLRGGSLTYRARSDGTLYAVLNHARGTYTTGPRPGG